jgi:hypothetical protein
LARHHERGHRYGDGSFTIIEKAKAGSITTQRIMPLKKYRVSIAAAGLAITAGAFFWWNCQSSQTPAKVVTNEKQMAYYAEIMTGRLFNIQLNGALRLSYFVHNDPELRAAGFQCALAHAIEVTPEGTARSRWVLPFTESYLVPYDVSDLSWRQPNGRTVLFRNGQTAQGSVVRGEDGWQLEKIGPSAYYIHNDLGDSFSYDHGCLSGITTRSGRHYRVTTRGGLIEKVAEIGRQNYERTLFFAEFDDFGHCLLVQFPGCPAEVFAWDDQGFLKDWKEAPGRHVGFQYDHGLLVRVTGLGHGDFPITWSENREVINHSVGYGFPVWVKSAGTRNYMLSYASCGIIIAINCPDEAQNSTTIFNPWAHTLVQKSRGQTHRFYFDSIEDERILRPQKVEVVDSGK